MNADKNKRSRNWTFLQYDDSAPENWRDKLDELLIEWVESPLHDKDVDPTGEPKKAHRHIIVSFKGNKSYQQIKEISDMVSGIEPKVVSNMRSYLRYFAHLDNPEKYQYDQNKIIPHGGFNIDNYLQLTSSEVAMELSKIQDLIQEMDFTSYYDLTKYLKDNELWDWYKIATERRTYAIMNLIKSYTYKHEETDPETGEKYYVGDFLKK